MKKFALLVAVVVLAVLAGVSQVVHVSATDTGETVDTEIQTHDFADAQTGAKLSADGTKLTVHEVKNGATRTPVASAID